MMTPALGLHLIVLTVLILGFIYCFKRSKSTAIWILLMLPPIFFWVAHRFFPYTDLRGKTTDLEGFLIDTFDWSFSNAYLLNYVLTFILCWSVVIGLEAITFKLLMWQKKSDNLEEEIFVCSDCEAEVSGNDMVCPKCGADLNEIVE